MGTAAGAWETGWSKGGGVVGGSFGEVRHAGPGLEEAAKAEASWGPSEARGPARGSRSQSQEGQL